VDGSLISQDVVCVAGGAVPSAAANFGAENSERGAMLFGAGDLVEARWMDIDGHAYYGAVVAAVHADGTYTIDWDDGERRA
jgi:hypothetical protein